VLRCVRCLRGVRGVRGWLCFALEENGEIYKGVNKV